ILGPTMDPAYPPLLDPAHFGTNELMLYLQTMEDNGGYFNYTELSYEQQMLTPSQVFYPYAELYRGLAFIESIETVGTPLDAPEPSNVYVTSLCMVVVTIWRRKKFRC